MRIIAGLAKGRRLYAPSGLHTRPTADRVREAVFSVILPRLPGAKVLDVFAGSGALGLEALSRGADLALFIEQDAAALKALRRNVETCNLKGAEIFPGEALRFLHQNREQYDIIFLDPPYRTELLEQTLAAIVAGYTVAVEGLIVAESAAQRQLTPPPQLITVKRSVYGDTAIHYLQVSQPI